MLQSILSLYIGYSYKPDVLEPQTDDAEIIVVQNARSEY